MNDKYIKTECLENNSEKKVAFTICSLNYLYMAISARESFLFYNNEWEFIIIIQDMISNQNIIPYISDLTKDNVTFLFSLGIKNDLPYIPIEEINTRYKVYESNTAIKPYVFSYFFNKDYGKVCYFDPDILFYDKINELDKLLDNHNVILTPHLLTPAPEDGKDQCNQMYNLVGVYNCGFVAMSYSENTKIILKFWETELKKNAYDRPSIGLFTDQIWANFFPAFSDKCFILRNPGYNAAYWNLHERVISFNNGKWYVNDKSLVFFHFSGLSLDNINLISKHQNRFTLNDRENDLRILFENYVNIIIKNKIYIFSKQKYFFNTLPHRTFLLNNKKRDKIANSFLQNDIYPFSGDGNKNLYWTKKANSRFKYLKFPVNPISFLKDYFSKEQSFGINLIGYFDEMHSLGEVARSLTKRIYATGIPFSIYNVYSGARKITAEEAYEYSLYSVKKPLYPINIIIVNADQTQNIFNQNKEIFKNKINLGVWIWEFETGFAKYAGSYKCLDGIIVTSDYVSKCIGKYLPDNFPISKNIYHCININYDLIEKNIIRNKYNIPLNSFAVFFNFDYNSSYDRKNPEAILRAFNNVFNNINNTCLVIKTTNKKNDPVKENYFNELINSFGLNKRVYLIDEFITKQEMLSLINACDVYVSLHRAEGFGLGLLEAMYLGKPVIASNYSGNLDFMNKENSILIDVKFVPVKTDFEPYKDVEYWAEPDENQAAQELLKLYNNPDYAKNLGKSACDSVSERFKLNNFIFDFYKLINFAFNIKKDNFKNPDFFVKYEIGNIVSFNNEKSIYQIIGWSHAENWGTWTEGERVIIAMKILSNSNLLCKINVLMIFNENPVDIYINDNLIDSYKFIIGENKVKIKKEVIRNNILVFQFVFKDIKSPYELNISDDKRKLGIGINYFSIEENN